MAYIVNLRVENKTNDALTVVEKTCWHYANGATWTEHEDDHLLSMGGSGTSGMLRFRFSTGEKFCLALGIHNHEVWCDIIANLKDNDTATKIHQSYYDRSRGGKREELRSEIMTRTAEGTALHIKVSKNADHEFHADIKCEQHAAQPFSDSEIESIPSQLRSRIYKVLDAIGALQDMNAFTENGITDLWLPLLWDNLPLALSPTALALFQDNQKIVLTGADKLEDGEHCHLTEDDLTHGRIPKALNWERFLGSGGGSVDVCVVKGRKEVYALKSISRGKDLAEMKEVMRYITSELKVMEKLRLLPDERRHHFVKLIGSYTTPKYVGLIISPVAKGDLQSFLSEVPGSTEKGDLLWGFFGCLADALVSLAFLRIRHKDIKPANILVKGYNVLLTDFGMALDWTDIGRTTTQDEQRRSPEYCAPEAATNKPTHTSADIWSLGCVYFDIMTVLSGETLAKRRKYFQENGSEDICFWNNEDAISGWLAVLRKERGTKGGNEPLDWIERMLKQKEYERPNARTLKDDILRHTRDKSWRMPFCGICCR